MKQTSLDALNNHMFEAIEMLKNSKDPNASENEKIDIETAKTIAEIGKVIVDGFKVKAQVLNIISRNDVLGKELIQSSVQSGLLTEDVKQIS